MKQSGLKVSFYLKKSEMSDDGLCPVMGRINVGRYSEAAFSAKLSASPKAWMLGRATGKSAASREINRQLDEIRASALSVYQELSAVRMGVTADDVKCQIQGMAFGQETLMGYFSTFIENFAKRVGVNRPQDGSERERPLDGRQGPHGCHRQMLHPYARVPWAGEILHQQEHRRVLPAGKKEERPGPRAIALRHSRRTLLVIINPSDYATDGY